MTHVLIGERFWTWQGHWGTFRIRWGLTDNEMCDIQTMSHIVDSCPRTKLCSGLQRLHTEDKDWLIDWVEFNGTFGTNRLYCAFKKYVAVKKNEINEKVGNVTITNLQSGLCRETLCCERYHKSIVFSANHSANVLTNKTTMTQKIPT